MRYTVQNSSTEVESTLEFSIYIDEEGDMILSGKSSKDSTAREILYINKKGKLRLFTGERVTGLCYGKDGKINLW